MSEKGTVIHPLLDKPPGVFGVSYLDTESESGSQYDDDVVSTVLFEDASSQPTAPDDGRLFPPNWVSIISQTARVSASGGVVVDVVVEVEEIPTVSDFEVRLTKA